MRSGYMYKLFSFSFGREISETQYRRVLNSLFFYSVERNKKIIGVYIVKLYCDEMKQMKNNSNNIKIRK